MAVPRMSATISRSRASAEGGRVRDQGQEAGRRQGPAREGRNPVPDPAMERIALFYQPYLERLGVTVSFARVDDVQYRKSPAQFRFRHDHGGLGAVDLARATSSAISSARRLPIVPAAATFPASRTRRSTPSSSASSSPKSRDELVAALQGARSRAALELLRGAALQLSAFQRYAHWDRFSHPDPLPEIWRLRFPHAVVVGCGEGGQDGQTLLSRAPRSLSFSRRHVLGLGAAALSAPWLKPARAAVSSDSHGISVFGDLKYPPDFHHFDYVNVDAPKGGLISTIPGRRASITSPTLPSTRSTPSSSRAKARCGMELTFATLMARAGDEPDAVYGQVAKSVQISSDKLTYRFTLRPEARFHDGSRLTAHDVAFSLTTLKAKGHPLIILQMRDMVKAEALDDATLVVTFAEKRGRDVPLFVATLPIFSKAYYATATVRRIDARHPAGIGAVQGRQVRGQSLHRIRSGQGLVGRRSAGQSRPVQFRRRPSRILSRPRRRLRRLYRQELSVPRGIHLAHLGDALRLPRHQGWPRQARAGAR